MNHILTLTCPDRPGIVHAVCSGLLDVGGNIVENAQFSEPITGTFCMRLVCETPQPDPVVVRDAVLARLADPTAQVTVRAETTRPRVLIMVSKFDHCLVDLLYRWRTGALPIDIPVIVSNHPDCALMAATHGIPYVHLPVTAEHQGFAGGPPHGG